MTRWFVSIWISAGMLFAQQTKAAPKANSGVDHVIEALSGGASEDLIIETLHSEGKIYTLTIADLAKLKKAGASDNIIRVMKNPKAEETEVPLKSAAGPPAGSTGSFPKRYDSNFMVHNTAPVIAVNGKTIYLGL